MKNFKLHLFALAALMLASVGHAQNFGYVNYGPGGTGGGSGDGETYFKVNTTSETMYIDDGTNPVSATAINNFCVGINACSGLTTGVRNTGVGNNALKLVANGSRMTAVGWNSLSNVSGTNSLNCNAVGNLSGGNLVHCRNSVINGVEAARFAHEVSNTFALGSFVLDASGGVHWNTLGIGYQALTAATYTRDVTAVGNQSGIGLVSGTNVLLLGSSTNGPGTTLHGFMNLGNTIFGNMISSTAHAITGGGAGTVGINVVTPTANLDISGTLNVTSLSTVASLAAGGLTVTGDSLLNNVSVTGAISTSYAGAASATLCVGISGEVYRGSPGC